MQRHLDTGLSLLSEQLLGMAGYVEQAIQGAIDGWRQRSLIKIREVHGISSTVNDLAGQVDDTCFKLLALQQPFAADLRLIIASIKINGDLERMVDLAVNIANNTELYLQSPALFPVADVASMADDVKIMVRAALDSFVTGDAVLARGVLERDDTVDAFNRKIGRELVERMGRVPDSIPAALNVILIAKNLERIGDHATHIAEDVIFSVSGEDIRHAERTRPLNT